MNLIDSLKAKAESERAKGEAQWFPLAEQVAAGTASEKDIAAVLKATGKTLDDLQVTVDRVHEIARLKALTDQYRERQIGAYRSNLELRKFIAFQRKTIRDLETEETQVRVSSWHKLNEATESREAFAKLSKMTGLQHPVPRLETEQHAIDAEFAADPVASTVLPSA